MRIVLFYHSLVSDWNHGNAHFLRGVVRDLLRRGHDVAVYEPRDGWSLTNLLREHGGAALQSFRTTYPELHSCFYDLDTLDLDAALDGADLVLVHEWSDPSLVERLGRKRRRDGTFRLLFHDTHHRCATAPKQMRQYDLRHYDGVLAFGRVIAELYRRRGWAAEAWTWHEAADVTVYRPHLHAPREGDLVWVGNWGDEERSAELREFLIEPARDLGLRTMVHGVRYPDEARSALRQAGIACGGWLPAARVPAVFSRFRMTVHVPRRPYVEHLPGIPTIRIFEALACGVPLICSPWDDAEGLFTIGRDYLLARTGEEMKRWMRALLHDDALARELAGHGRRTVLDGHTCAHRVDELMSIAEELGLDTTAARPEADLPAPVPGSSRRRGGAIHA